MEYFFNEVLILEKLPLGKRMAVFYLGISWFPLPILYPNPGISVVLRACPALPVPGNAVECGV